MACSLMFWTGTGRYLVSAVQNQRVRQPPSLAGSDPRMIMSQDGSINFSFGQEHHIDILKQREKIVMKTPAQTPDMTCNVCHVPLDRSRTPYSAPILLVITLLFILGLNID
ncbi:hypothetical protein J6590_031146 [Homalodisca vitripennis]|nr:hypothetical protein J6590_031146 [Homalodisca vitripennis]